MKNLLVLLALFLIPNLSAQVSTPDLGDSIYWDVNTEPDVDEYHMYRSTVPCVDSTPTPQTCAGFAQVAVIPQAVDPMSWIEPGPVVFVQDYYYRVLSHNTSNLVSAFSNELNVRWFNPNAPGIPGDLRGTEMGANMRLDWDEPALEEHVTVWNVYKSAQQGLVGNIIARTNVTEYRDINPGRDGPRYYNVTAVNSSSVESDPAGPIEYVGN